MQESYIPEIEAEGNTESESHLRPGIRPIMACVGTSADYADPDQEYINDPDSYKEEELVEYQASSDTLEARGQKHDHDGTYVISKIDAKDKFSYNYTNCSGVAVVGIDKETGEEVSFLTHQFPGYFLDAKNQKFDEDLNASLDDILESCEPGTVDAVIFGGNFLKQFSGYSSTDEGGKTSYSQKMYLRSVKHLSDILEKKLSFEPLVIVGPKNTQGDDNFLLKTKERQLYVIRDQREWKAAPPTQAIFSMNPVAEINSDMSLPFKVSEMSTDPRFKEFLV